MSDRTSVKAAWEKKLKALSETVWADKIELPMITQWLENFRGEVGPVEEERHHALHLLQSFMYFGIEEIRELVRVFYRDTFRYPIIQELRESQGNTANSQALEDEFRKTLNTNTRFIGVGRPSESGTHLLYYVRQENDLPVELFCNLEHIFVFEPNKPPMLRDLNITRFVFFDDFCGSGEQVKDYLAQIAASIRSQVKTPKLSLCYFPLFATTWGLEEIRKLDIFTEVRAVLEFDSSYQAFSGNSMYFERAAEQFVDKQFSEKLFRHYGSKLWPQHPVGYRSGQLLTAFFHNTPDNVLPPFWCVCHDPHWTSIFHRYRKLTF